MDTLRPRLPFLSILGWIWGASWDLLWTQFYVFSVIWGGKMGDIFQVRVFGDPGVEIMAECSD